MGLDMYLSRKIYVGLNYENDIKGETKIIINGKEHDYEKLESLIFEAAYWRKCNQIHNWFVNNVQDGDDNCATYYVDRGKLKELIDLCKKDVEYIQSLEYTESEEYKYKIFIVDENKINLPTVDGFFFGSTEYNEYYLEDLNDTIIQLEKALEEDGEFYYSSSW